MALIGAQFVNAVSPNPVGSLQAFAGANAPYGWLLCDAGQHAISQYPELYSVLGTTYGALTNGSGGAGSTHFRVPDLRGRMPIGAGNDGTAANNATRTRGSKGGDTRLQAHNHKWTPTDYVSNDANGSNQFNGQHHITRAGAAAWYGGTNTADSGSGSGENMPPFLVTNYIIKAVPDAPRSGLAYGSTPPIVTALPANPQFGDVVTYIANAANGVAWTLQYDASGTYPWKFIGGAPLTGLDSGAVTFSDTTISGAPNRTPTLTIGLAGDYEVRAWCYGYGNSATARGIIGTPYSSTGVSIPDEQSIVLSAVTNNMGQTGTSTKVMTLATGTISLRFKVPNGLSSNVEQRGMTVTPVRVKAA